MPILHLDTKIQSILLLLILLITQAGSAKLVQHIPDQFIRVDLALFKTRQFEQEGLFYDKVFQVKRWKKYLPDGGAYFKGGYSRKHVKALDTASLAEHLEWNCRGELSHWLNFIPLFIFPLILNPSLYLLVFIYSVLANLPCLISYRYNRPRLMAILSRKKK